MGRVKLQIKKIENTTNRQVTFSKRRNGLIKKAYELSVLCDVDVALIMFSPSGRVSIFSGNRSMEEIMARYVNLPEHERGSPASVIDSHVEEIQQDIIKCRSQIEDMEKRLRIYEGDISDITTLCEAEYREHILDGNLKQVRQVLQGQYNSPDLNVLACRNAHDNVLDWLPQRDPQVQILNFLDSNCLLPMRDEAQRMDNMLPSSLALYEEAPPSSNVNVHNNQHLSTTTTTAAGGSSTRVNINEDDDAQRQDHLSDQVIDVNLSPWAEFYQTAGSDPFPAEQPRERALLELFLSQLTPVHQDHHI
ncbi:hypothetical protein ACJIZ3_013601 [Penstemon smallii]|uniref:MADS-box domain-containing protein n=1 Tax=Penstemon smallii TaxID=265156 RepID=A0ABD3RHL0_9LAMI